LGTHRSHAIPVPGVGIAIRARPSVTRLQLTSATALTTTSAQVVAL
jgi:hypothetical protein